MAAENKLNTYQNLDPETGTILNEFKNESASDAARKAQTRLAQSKLAIIVPAQETGEARRAALDRVYPAPSYNIMLRQKGTDQYWGYAGISEATPQQPQNAHIGNTRSYVLQRWTQTGSSPTGVRVLSKNAA
jgi:hypothetical protein